MAAGDCVTAVRLPRELHDRITAFAAEKAKTSGLNVTIADAIRFLLDRGLTEATRKRGT